MKPEKPERIKVGQKIDYLMDCLDNFDLDYIRYFEFSTSHLIVNTNQKWAYLVHDPGIVVGEISFEAVNFDKAVKKFGNHLEEFAPGRL
jgi:hypothetical protein